jgi:hypothetical protein
MPETAERSFSETMLFLSGKRVLIALETTLRSAALPMRIASQGAGDFDAS